MNRVKNALFSSVLLFSLFCLVGPVGAVSAGEPVAHATAGADKIIWQPVVENAGLVLTVVGPDAATFDKTFDAGINPYFELLDNHGNRFGDGQCTYELRVIAVVDPEVRSALEAARKSGDESVVSELRRAGKLPEGVAVQSGSFLIKNGGIVMGEASAAGAAGDGDPAQQIQTSSTNDIAGVSLNEQVINDDLIVTGSICVGFDCVIGEDFGKNTIVLKEQNLGIYFQDTSDSTSFPTNDWRISVNSSAEAGENSFAITDVDGGVTPFKVMAGAPDSSIYLDSFGRLGLGTSTPTAQVHIASGDSPSVRLHQDNSLGLEAQTWDVAGNESSFFIRDATNGFNVPFKIEPGAPTGTLSLTSDGKVGIGTWEPAEPLELETTAADARFVANRTDGATALVSGSRKFAVFGAATVHPMRFVSAARWLMQLNLDRSLQMRNGATCDATGHWNDYSSREAKENIESLTVSEAMDTMQKLDPVKFNFKSDASREGYVGFIAEDVPVLVATGDRKHINAVDIVAVLTKVVQSQQKTIDKMSKKMTELERKLNEKEAQTLASIRFSSQSMR